MLALKKVHANVHMYLCVSVSLPVSVCVLFSIQCIYCIRQRLPLANVPEKLSECDCHLVLHRQYKELQLQAFPSILFVPFCKSSHTSCFAPYTLSLLSSGTSLSLAICEPSKSTVCRLCPVSPLAPMEEVLTFVTEEVMMKLCLVSHRP